jgi:hypothetical protein
MIAKLNVGGSMGSPFCTPVRDYTRTPVHPYRTKPKHRPRVETLHIRIAGINHLNQLYNWV